MLHLRIIVLPILLIVGCTAPDERTQIVARNAAERQRTEDRVAAMNADYLARVRSGKPPANYRKVIDLYWAGALRDPGSRQVKVTGNPYGGLVCGTVNAKNAFGGYTGAQTFFVAFDHSGSLFDRHIAGDDSVATRTSPVYMRNEKLLSDCS